MDCEESLEKLWQYLDQELDGETSAHLAEHLEECRHCFDRAEFERKLKAMVRRSCECEHAPAELRDRLTKLLRMF